MHVFHGPMELGIDPFNFDEPLVRKGWGSNRIPIGPVLLFVGCRPRFAVVPLVLFFNPESQRLMPDFPPTTEELLETFEELEEWDERYDFIIDLGRELPQFPSEYQTSEYIVDGCMSTVWLVVETMDAASPVKIQASSDSIIVKGLIAVMMSYYNKLSAEQVATADVGEFLGKLGLNQHLSPQRRNGLFSMIKRLRMEVATQLAASAG